MFCISCGKEIADDTRFCPYCGRDTTLEGAPPTVPPPPAPDAVDVTTGPPSPGASPPAPPTGPPYFAPPPAPPMAPPGGAPGAQAIQPPPLPPLPGRKMGGKKKALLIGIPSLVAAAVAVVLVLVLGGGMTPARYKEQVKPVHDEFVTSYAEMNDAWDNLPEETSLAEDYKELTPLAEDLMGEAEAAEKEVDGITPPEGLSSLHRDLLDYYPEVRDYLAKTLGVFDYLISWQEIATEWSETPYSVADLPDNATAPELAGAIQRDIATLQQFIDKVEELKPPAACKNLQDATVSSFKQEQQIFQQMNEAVAKNDSAALEALLARWQALGETKARALEDALGEASSFLADFDTLLEEGKDLQQQIDEIK